MLLPVAALLLGIQDAAPEFPCPSLEKGTLLTIAVTDNILSRTAHNEEYFHIKLAEPLIVDGKTIIPAGTPGIGQVVQASHPTFFANKEGELLVAARYLRIGGKYLPLRSFRINATTASIPDKKMLSYSTNVDIPAGSTATGKVAGECVDTVPTPVAFVK